VNLPEYRRERGRAYEQYQEQIESAAKLLLARLTEIDSAFLEEQDAIKENRPREM
jgi:hypothetical protein